MNNEDCFCPFDEELAAEIFKKQDKRIQELKAKLEKIKEIAKENNICEGFGCIPMYKILKVIEGAEDDRN